MSATLPTYVTSSVNYFRNNVAKTILDAIGPKGLHRVATVHFGPFALIPAKDLIVHGRYTVKHFTFARLTFREFCDLGTFGVPILILNPLVGVLQYSAGKKHDSTFKMCWVPFYYKI